MLSIFIRTIIIYVVLNIMLKIMGKRQIGELEVNELVSTLLISEIASAPITDGDVPMLYALIPILFICATEIVLAFIKNKLPLMKRAIEGKSVYIIYKGKLRQRVLAENRISINEILTEMRIQGIGDISEVEYGMLEQNGKVSLLKKADNAVHTLITDGELDRESMSELMMNEETVKNMIGERRIDEVFLLTVDDNGQTYIVPKEGGL